MSAATASAIREEIDGQWSGYWLDPGRQPPPTQPTYRPTGGIVRRTGEANRDESVCLDLVLVETASGFVWLPLSRLADTRTRIRSACSKTSHGDWRWEDDTVRVYKAEYAESLTPQAIASIYGAMALWRHGAIASKRKGVLARIVPASSLAFVSSTREDLARRVRCYVAGEQRVGRRARRSISCLPRVVSRAIRRRRRSSCSKYIV